MIDLKNYLTIKEAAEKLGYFSPYVNKLIRDGKLNAVKRGRQYFIAPEEINKYVGVPEPTQIDQLI
jgi:excisionase family DNA binding protein